VQTLTDLKTLLCAVTSGATKKPATAWPGIVPALAAQSHRCDRASVPLQRLLIIGAAFGLMVLLHLFLNHTVLGSTIVALAQDREGAALVGIDATRVTLLVFAISGALAAVAAVLYAPVNLVYPSMGNLVITKAFVIIILGGMGSFPGAIVGGLIIGLAESFGGFYFSTDYKDIIAFVLLVVILSFRPQGLFTPKGVRG